MRVKIGNRLWTLRRARIRDFGECDSPDTPGKEIRIRANLSGETELETLVHELAHAAQWWADEEHIEQMASDVARVLWRYGYRRVGDEHYLQAMARKQEDKND